ncbi:MAG: glycine cleavage system aminomethyltransferase GcvT [Chthoniobacterales bacterium]
MSLKYTPLRESHLEAQARMVDFAGWSMPVQYRGIIEEHRAVRDRVGMFDISHMGEFFIEADEPGKAEGFLNHLLTNNVDKLAEGEGQYTLMLNEKGGVIDDLIVYRVVGSRFLLIVNAACIDIDEAWIAQHLPEGVRFENRSEEFAAIAVQGPEAANLFYSLFADYLPPRNRLVRQRFSSEEVFCGITGYTGENGFEVFCPVHLAFLLWNRLVELGAEPCGLGARDTLRLEAGLPLNGSDLSQERTPLEAGLGFFVDFEKPSFIGREILIEQKEKGPAVRLAGLKVLGKAPPLRPHYAVFQGDVQVGETSSGALSPTLGHGIAFAYLPADVAKIGSEVEIDIRGRRYPACVSKKQFYKKTRLK